jgi:trimeric autotransporter adhesin
MPSLTPLTLGLPSIDNLTNVNGTLFFTASNTLGNELWKTDGTVNGTVLVKDISPGDSSSLPASLINIKGTVYFSAYDEKGNELWKSDGTANGTVLVKDIRTAAGSDPSGLINVNDTLYFVANDNVNGRELWKSDGTAAGTVLVKDINVGTDGITGTYDFPNMINFKGSLLIDANDGVKGRELWKSDGTAAGTVLVKDINVGTGSSNSRDFTVVNDTVLFVANDGVNGDRLWKTDGTTNGTVLVSILPQDLSDLTNVNGTVFFAGSNYELWKTDGTTSGTVLVKNIRPNYYGPNVSNLTNVNGTLFFVIDDNDKGRELWKSDGTASGTVLVKDIVEVGRYGSDPADLINLKGILFFTADDQASLNLAGNPGKSGRELWKSDGTAGNTVLVYDINPGSLSSSTRDLTKIDNQLYFVANDGNGERLFKFNNDPNPKLNTSIRRFQNSGVPGTYIFAGESEAANIRTNFKGFKEEGLAFQVGVEKSDPLMQPLYRFQNSSIPGTYLFAGESEAANIRVNFKNFKEEGIAFYVFGVGSGQGITFNRFQNTSKPGTYLFAGPEETNSILANNKNFVLEGTAFEVGG